MNDRDSVCLSRLALDRLLANERRGCDAALDHLQTCERCRARLEALRTEQAAKLTEQAVNAGVERVLNAEQARQSGWKKWLRPVFWMPAGAATLAALLLWVQFNMRKPAGSDDSIRLKGSP